MVCEIEDCERDARSRGWCRMHYERWKRHGDPRTLVTVPATERPCVYSGCSEPRRPYPNDPRRVYTRCAQHQREYEHEKRRKNKDRINAANRRYYNQPTIKAARKIYSQEYQKAQRKAYPEKVKAADKRNHQKYYASEEVRLKTRARTAKWKDENPEGTKRNALQGAAIRRMRTREQFIEHISASVVYEMHGGRCGICGEFIVGPFHVDHIIPLAKGGSHGYANVQPAHPTCNIRKKDKMP